MLLKLFKEILYIYNITKPIKKMTSDTLPAETKKIIALNLRKLYLIKYRQDNQEKINAKSRAAYLKKLDDDPNYREYTRAQTKAFKLREMAKQGKTPQDRKGRPNVVKEEKVKILKKIGRPLLTYPVLL